MGTLERIRKTSPYALALFAIMFIGFMVISDADVSNLLRQGKNYQTSPIAIVNGEELLYRDFNALVQERLEQMKANAKTPDFQPDEKQLRQDVWNEMIDKILLKQEAEQAGIFVSDEQILDIMLENPPEFLKKTFTDSAGNFNKAVYLDIVTHPENLQNYLASSYTPEKIQEQIINFKKDLLNIEKYLREQKLSESMNFLVNTSESILSPDFVKDRFDAENSIASVDFVFFDVSSIKDNEVKVSNKELKDYYEKNKQYYEQKPVRKIKYLRFVIQPSNDDTLRAQKKIVRISEELLKGLTVEQKDSIFDVKMSEYGGTSSDFIMSADVDPIKAPILDSLQPLQVIGPVNLGPNGISFFRLDERRTGANEMVKASHILINFGTNKDSAKKEAENILALTKNGDFSELAMKYSKDKGSGSKGGDLGFFGKGKMIKEFEQAAFAANVGQIVGPVESQFGFHIIKVIDKKSEEIKFSEINILPSISTATRNQLFREAYSIQKQSEEGAPFDSLVARLGLVAVSSSYVTRESPILGSNYLTYLAFENPIGTVFEPQELDKIGIVVAQVSDALQGGFVPLKNLKKQFIDEIKHSKKLDILEKRANDLYSKIKGYAQLQDITRSYPQYPIQKAEAFKKDANIPGIGIDYGFSEQVFKLPEGKISKPIRGARGYYIMQPFARSISNIDLKSPALYTYKTQLQRDSKQRAFYSWFGQVKKNAEIEDFRYDFYKDY